MGEGHHPSTSVTLPAVPAQSSEVVGPDPDCGLCHGSGWDHYCGRYDYDGDPCLHRCPCMTGDPGGP